VPSVYGQTGSILGGWPALSGTGYAAETTVAPGGAAKNRQIPDAAPGTRHAHPSCRRRARRRALCRQQRHHRLALLARLTRRVPALT